MANEFGDNVKRIRESLGMSQDEFAKLLGYRGRSSISKIEKGIKSVSRDKVAQFSKILGISPLEFFKDIPTSKIAVELSETEQSIINYYRNSPNFKAGVDSLVVALNIEKKSATNGSSSIRA